MLLLSILTQHFQYNFLQMSTQASPYLGTWHFFSFVLNIVCRPLWSLPASLTILLLLTVVYHSIIPQVYIVALTNLVRFFTKLITLNVLAVFVRVVNFLNEYPGLFILWFAFSSVVDSMQYNNTVCKKCHVLLQHIICFANNFSLNS
jgi:hypothetical protein